MQWKLSHLSVVVSALAGLFGVERAFATDFSDSLRLPVPGDHAVHVVAPSLLELEVIDTGNLEMWDWVSTNNAFLPPNLSSLKVIVDGVTNKVTRIGFRRRPVYAPLESWDLRLGNHLFLQLSTPVTDGQFVRVVNNGSLWSTNILFETVVDPLRYSAAIHVNQEGYLPGFPKKGMVGYYLGNMGELPLQTAQFALVDAVSGATVFQGTLTNRPDVGYTYTPTPYQNVWEADFSSFTNVGQYRLMVPGMGASVPFRICDGLGMDFARTYALGLFEQRSGFNVSMPFTRFTHAADHLAPATIPYNDNPPYGYTWYFIGNYAYQINTDNPPQVAPPMYTFGAQLFPFVHDGTIDASGGHFDAADYSKYSWDSAQLIHVLMYAVDSLPGVADLDNLGIPESGDGISDVMQEAKWEADCLSKLQDDDGGIFYLVYPRDREYESDVLPENGDPQVVWPKNTATTAAAVAALTQISSSPRFKQAYPAAASHYFAVAQKGWRFLTNAIGLYGMDDAYQKLAHNDDTFTDRDDLSWAACEMYLATGDTNYQNLLMSWFPDPTDPATFRWGWWRMNASYGCLIRDYTSAVKNGRLAAGQLNTNYFALCLNTLTNAGNDTTLWSQHGAYGSSFPDVTKLFLTAGWYFSSEQAFDIVAAQQFNPNPAYVDAIVANLNYEAGCNPLNVSMVTGLGWIRQRELVDQYSANDKHVMPKSGIPLGNVQQGFTDTPTYGAQLNALVYPTDGTETAPYPFYDRWSDFWNVTTEASTINIAHEYVTALWLAAQTQAAARPWGWTNAVITPERAISPLGQSVTVHLDVADTNLSDARITWEAMDQEPTFGSTNFTFTPNLDGEYWVEAEIQWPDGRRAFATNSLVVSAGPQIRGAHAVDGGMSFQLAGVAWSSFVIFCSTNLVDWAPVGTNSFPDDGIADVAVPLGTQSRCFFRAMTNPWE